MCMCYSSRLIWGKALLTYSIYFRNSSRWQKRCRAYLESYISTRGAHAWVSIENEARDLRWCTCHEWFCRWYQNSFSSFLEAKWLVWKGSEVWIFENIVIFLTHYFWKWNILNNFYQALKSSKNTDLIFGKFKKTQKTRWKKRGRAYLETYISTKGAHAWISIENEARDLRWRNCHEWFFR